MRYSFLLAAVGGLAAAAVSATDAGAQARRRVSFDATLGPGRGIGGAEYASREQFGADLLLALARPRAAGAAVVAVSAGVQGRLGGDQPCVTSRAGGCVPAFPALYPISLLLGREAADGVGRLLAGPTFVAVIGGGTALGVHGRVDLATPQPASFAGVLSLRATLFPRLRGETVGILAAGIGLRVRPIVR